MDLNETFAGQMFQCKRSGCTGNEPRSMAPST